MRNFFRASLICAAMLAALILILYLNSVIFVQGPYFKDYSEDQKYHQAMMKEYRSPEGELLNRYALSEITYISRLSQYGENWIFWYDQQLNLKARLRESGLDISGAVEKARQCCAFEGTQVSYGWKGDRPAFLLEDAQREILLDAETLELLMNFEKGK